MLRDSQKERRVQNWKEQGQSRSHEGKLEPIGTNCQMLLSLSAWNPQTAMPCRGAGGLAAELYVCPTRDSDNLRQKDQQELQKLGASWWATCVQPAQSLMSYTHLPGAMIAAVLLSSKSHGNFSVANSNPETFRLPMLMEYKNYHRDRP